MKAEWGMGGGWNYQNLGAWKTGPTELEVTPHTRESLSSEAVLHGPGTQTSEEGTPAGWPGVSEKDAIRYLQQV